MKKTKSILFMLFFMLLASSLIVAQQAPVKGSKKATNKNAGTVDTRVDNMGYWQEKASQGLVSVAPNVPVEPATFTGSKIHSPSVLRDDSPDVPLTTVNSTQSECSVFADPNDKDHALNSNNSTQNPVGQLYGANDFWTSNGGTVWGGEVQGAGGANSGDPATAIGNGGRMYVNYIHNNYGQGISYSDNDGANWTAKQVAPNPGSMCDKNHMWIDNSVASPYEGNLYVAWTNFGGSYDTEIGLARSTNDGVTWSSPIVLSTAINAGSHNQGVNLQTGPGGQVYALWAVYDSWPSDETALGFAKSLDGGATFAPATRIISNIKGIRTSGTHKNQRVNSFPSMAVDISNGANSGTIYAVWANYGVPGVNSGTGIDVYMIKSTNQGSTWSTPVRVNQDPIGAGKQHYFPWICCDPKSGTLSVIFYDDRNTTQTKCEVFAANSSNGGVTWEDFKISDISFTPTPIPGLAGQYMGDYLGITAQNRKVYPVWCDNRSGTVMAYTSPFETGPPPNQPWVVFNSFEIIDPNVNGKLEPGETVDLNVALANIGDQPATNVSATLSCTSPFITIINGSALFGNFNAGDTVTVANAFTIEAANNIPNGTAIPFTITATDGDSTWVSNFSITPVAPAFTIGNMTVLDASGNGNGILDPGETVDLSVATTNSGGVDAANTLATLACGSTYITINTATSNLETLLVGETKSALFNITVSPDAPLNTPVVFNYAVASGLYSAQKDFNKKIGLIVEDFESGGFTMYPWVMGGNQPWVITNVDPFEGVYSAKSGTITNNQTSTLSLQRNVTSPDSISFYFKTSSEANYDYLKFYIDGTVVDSWAGETPWTRKAYALTAANHTFKWEYMKDGSVSSGSDCAWVDYIQLPTTILTGVVLSGTVTYANTANTPLGGLTVKLKTGNTVYGTATTNSSGFYTFPLVPAGNYTFEVTTTKPWGGVTAADVLLYRKHIASITPLTGIYLASGDVNGSGTLSAADVLLIKKRIAAITNSFTVGDWLFNHTPFTVGNTNLVKNFQGLTYGDANGSYIPTANKSVSANHMGTVTLGSVSAAKHEIVVPVNLASIENLGAFQFTIRYDSKKLQIKNITDWTTGIEDVTVGTPAPGLLTFVWAADASGVSLVDQVLCNLHFISNSTDESALSFDSSPTSIEFTDYEGNAFTPDMVEGSIKSTTGIGTANQTGLSVYPNPSNGKFDIHFTSGQTMVNVKVVNATGAVVFEEKEINVATSHAKSMDLSNQPKGVYMLSIDDNQQVTSEKIVIR